MCPIDVLDPSLRSPCLPLSVAHPLGVWLSTAQFLGAALCWNPEIWEMRVGRGRFRPRNFSGVELVTAPGAKPKVRLEWLMRRCKGPTFAYRTHILVWGYCFAGGTRGSICNFLDFSLKSKHFSVKMQTMGKKKVETLCLRNPACRSIGRRDAAGTSLEP